MSTKRALALLQRAFELGAFSDAKSAAQLAADPQFKPLFERNEGRAFLEMLKK